MGYDALKDLGHGGQVLAQNQFVSKILICYLDGKNTFRYGFAFRNGSNTRVVTWANGKKKMRTVPRGEQVVAFCEVYTDKRLEDVFYEEDFYFDWFDGEAKRIVIGVLEALIPDDDDLFDICRGVAGLRVAHD